MHTPKIGGRYKRLASGEIVPVDQHDPRPIKPKAPRKPASGKDKTPIESTSEVNENGHESS